LPGGGEKVIELPLGLVASLSRPPRCGVVVRAPEQLAIVLKIREQELTRRDERGANP
jgi:hypothetical protein